MRVALRRTPPGIIISLMLSVIAGVAAFMDLPGRAVIGLPFILFIPGYVLILCLFPRQRAINIIDRVALSFGLSIAMVSLLLLSLNFTPWGIRMETIVTLPVVVTVFLAFLAWYRWLKLQPSERFTISFELTWPQSDSRIDQLLNIALVLSIVVTIALLAYILITPQVGESFTQFYLLGPNGRAADYPTAIQVGENASVIIGIVNHEQQSVNYTVEVWNIQYQLSLQFDGQNDYVEVPSSPDLNITDEISIEMWVRWDNLSGDRTLLAKKEITNAPQDIGPYGLGYRELGYLGETQEEYTGLWFRLCDIYNHSVILKNFYDPQTDVWQHYVAVWDGSYMKFYVNGTLVGSQHAANLGPLKKVENPLYIGSDLGTHSFFDGSIKDVRIYSRSLTLEEIQANYHDNITTDAIVAWWPFTGGFNFSENVIEGPNAFIRGASWLTGNITDVRFMDKVTVSLNHTSVGDNENWGPQWEKNYTFSINRTGSYKVLFLLFKNITDDFMPGRQYLAETERVEEAYLENHLWISVHEHINF